MLFARGDKIRLRDWIHVSSELIKEVKEIRMRTRGSNDDTEFSLGTSVLGGDSEFVFRPVQDRRIKSRKHVNNYGGLGRRCDDGTQAINVK